MSVAGGIGAHSVIGHFHNIIVAGATAGVLHSSPGAENGSIASKVDEDVLPVNVVVEDFTSRSELAADHATIAYCDS